MADEKRPALSETFFLPPLTMVLSFFDRDIRKRAQKPGEEQKEADEKMVVKLIEKLSEKEAKD